MVDHIAHHPEVRDLALFVGNPEDIVEERLGPQLPMIRDWTERHFAFTGYITGFSPAELPDPGALRAELGYREDERVCLVSVGGTGVGADLLRRVIAAFPEAKERIPALRMIVVAGPRIDPASFRSSPGLEVVPCGHNLYRHLAACDVAVVQGGLTTAMELTASKRRFLYFPLRHHFEQNYHVRHRLERYGAGRYMDYDGSPPEAIAAALAAENERVIAYRDVETTGAAKAAEHIAHLL
jgi:predicted glycosyltransferase